MEGIAGACASAGYSTGAFVVPAALRVTAIANKRAIPLDKERITRTEEMIRIGWGMKGFIVSKQV
jgi:hypothetical protein